MPKKIVTHNSTFHADDVFAVATLLIIEPDAEVIRTRDENIISSADYVVDVGQIYDKDKKRFDHHQLGGAGKRDDGIEYASFGLVWKEYGEKIAGGKEEADFIERILVKPIDAHDNGIPLSEYFYEDLRYFTISDFLYSYLPRIDNTEEEINKAFMEVLVITKSLILREVGKSKKVVEDDRKVKQVYESSIDKRLIVMDEANGWNRILMSYEEPLFVVYPRPDGKWSVKAVPKSNKVFGLFRKLFPSSWAGKSDEDLVNETGVDGAVFVHKNLFLAVAKTKDGAIELANKAINA